MMHLSTCEQEIFLLEVMVIVEDAGLEIVKGQNTMFALLAIPFTNCVHVVTVEQACAWAAPTSNDVATTKRSSRRVFAAFIEEEGKLIVSVSFFDGSSKMRFERSSVFDTKKLSVTRGAQMMIVRPLFKHEKASCVLEFLLGQ